MSTNKREKKFSHSKCWYNIFKHYFYAVRTEVNIWCIIMDIRNQYSNFINSLKTSEIEEYVDLNLNLETRSPWVVDSSVPIREKLSSIISLWFMPKSIPTGRSFIVIIVFSKHDIAIFNDYCWPPILTITQLIFFFISLILWHKPKRSKPRNSKRVNIIMTIDIKRTHNFNSSVNIFHGV